MNDAKDPRLDLTETFRDGQSIADTPFEAGDITAEERDEYNRIANKIWQAEIDRMRENNDE